MFIMTVIVYHTNKSSCQLYKKYKIMMHFSVSIIDHLRKNKKIIKSVLSSTQSRVLTCPAVLCRHAVQNLD